MDLDSNASLDARRRGTPGNHRKITTNWLIRLEPEFGLFGHGRDARLHVLAARARSSPAGVSVFPHVAGFTRPGAGGLAAFGGRRLGGERDALRSGLLRDVEDVDGLT